MAIVMHKIKNQKIVPDRRSDVLFLLSLLLLAMAAFTFLGSDSYVMFADSGSYMEMERYMEGVMPVYPLFLRMNKILFGEAAYLQAVVMEQAIFASICVTVFTNLLRRQFGLGYVESYCLFLFSLLPFTTDMPDAMTTQEIITEGIAYAGFYLFMAALLKAVWTKKLRYILLLFVITLFLAATRSQLQILFGVCGIIFCYIVVMGDGTKAGRRAVLYVLPGLVGCLCIGFLGVFCTSRVNTGYQEMIRRYTDRLQEIEDAAMEEKMAEGHGETVGETRPDDVRGTEDEELSKNIQAESGREMTLGNSLESSPENAEDSEDSGSGEEWTAVPSQYTSLIFARGMYEADYEDYQLFQEEELRQLFLRLYETADENKSLYTYATPGLWMWKDIVGGIGSVGNKCFYTLDDFYREMPGITQRNDYNRIRNESVSKIGWTLLQAHWTRFLYHTVMMLPQAFICTVFFQIARIYLLCHLVTLFLYVSAVALMVWAYADKKVDKAYGEFMAAVLGTNILMIVVISLVFFGQQRYLVYNFGIFYMVYFLLLLQLWKIYGKNWFTWRFTWKKS